MVWLYIFAGVVLAAAFFFYFHLRFKLAVTLDALNLKAVVCVTFFKLKTICFDLALEKNFLVFYNKKGVPIYYPFAGDKNTDENDAANKELKSGAKIYFPVFDKINFKSLCMTTAVGVSGNAAATAVSLSVARLAYDAAFSIISHRGNKMKICRELIPVYGNNCIKTEISSIFTISLANIILYIVVILLKSLKVSRGRGD